jgi:hypothetical protein
VEQEPAPPDEFSLAPDEVSLGLRMIDGDVAVPRDVFRQIKNAERARLEQELAERAVRLGFSGVVPMIEALEEIGRAIDQPAPPQEINEMSDPVVTPAPQTAAPAAAPAPIAAPVVAPPAFQAPVTPPQPPAPAKPAAPTEQELANQRAIPDHIRRRMQADQQKQNQRYNALQQQHTTEAARAAQLEQQLAATREEMNIRVDLSQLGVKDLDFAWFSLSNHLKQLSADTSPEGQKKLASFSVQAWAEEQRATRPYIFGTQPVPANTGAVGGPGAAPAPAQPTTPQVAAAAGGAGAFDARAASPRDFEEQMRARGINYSGAKPMRR